MWAVRHHRDGVAGVVGRGVLAVVATVGALVWSGSTITPASAAASGAALVWSAPVNIGGSDSITGVSCPTASFCAAVDGSGNVLTSTNPTGGAGAWEVVSVGNDVDLSGISCPTRSFCVAVGSIGTSGVTVTSTDPTGGVGAWTATTVTGTTWLSSVSCPSVTLCAATSGYGGPTGIVTSTDPTGGATAWRLATVGAETLDDISCPSTSLCVAVGGQPIQGDYFLGDVVTSTDPTGGAGTWVVSASGGVGLFGISCSSNNLCAAAGETHLQPGPGITGAVATTIDPTGGWGSWTSSTNPATLGGPLGNVSCPSQAFCAMVGLQSEPGNEQGAIWTSADPTGGAGTWSMVSTEENTLMSISCPSSSFCVAGDDSGNVVVGTTTPPPVISSLSPSTGSTAGGDPVTIAGSGLSGATAVNFGSAPATIIGCTSSTCNVLAPAGAAGQIAVTVTTRIGTSSSAPVSSDTYTYVTPPSAGVYVPLSSPVRICDTRPGQVQTSCPRAATLGPDGVLAVTVGGNDGVPSSDVTAAVVNLTAVNATTRSYLTAYPDGQAAPATSSLNAVPGRAVANLVTVGLSSAGIFDVANHAGSTDVVVDLEGYYDTTSTYSGRYNPLATPARICDTRTGNPSGLSGTALTQCQGLFPLPGSPLSVTVDGLGGVPSTGVSAVVLNLTAVASGRGSLPGHLTVYASGTSAPTTSNVNFGPGQTVANRVIVPVGADGAVEIATSTEGPDVLVDVSGWFTDGSVQPATGGVFTPAVSPTRVCDTRSGLAYSTPCAGQAVEAGSPLTVAVSGVDGIPGGVTAVVANVTAVMPTSQTSLTVYPSGAQPTVSDLNAGPGQVVADLAVATVSATGTIRIADYAGAVDVVVDILGWYEPVTVQQEDLDAQADLKTAETSARAVYGRDQTFGTSSADMVASLAGLDPTQTFVTDGDVSGGPDTISVAVDTTGNGVILVARSLTGTCWGTLFNVYPSTGPTVAGTTIAWPETGAADTWDLSYTGAPCAADLAAPQTASATSTGWYLPPPPTEPEPQAAQSNLNTALTGAKAIYGNNQSFGATSEQMVTTLTNAEASLTFVSDTVAATAPYVISVAVDATGNGLLLTTQSVPGTCWAVMTNESATTGPTMAGNAIAWPEDTSAGTFYLAFTGSSCTADAAAVQTASATSSGWVPNAFPTGP